MKLTLITYIISFLYLQGCIKHFPKHNTTVEFIQLEINFGELEFKNPSSCSFEFVNSGETPLIIQKVETFCGCTSPYWTDEPILPGKTGEILVSYDAAQPGMFFKTVKVHFNGKDSPQTLRIRGSVNLKDN